jgi:ketosteroid isomerase-like protein
MNNRIKALLIAVAALPLAVGCSSDGDSSSDAADQARETQLAYIEAFQAGDVAAMNELYDADVRWSNPTHGDVNTGMAQMLTLDRWAVQVADMDQTEIVDHFVSDDGTRGVIVFHFVGARSDNGEPFDLDMTQVYEYDDGKIVSIDVSWANPDARDQLMN